MFDALIFIRAIHFAATAAVTGGVLFLVFVYRPALQENRGGGPAPAIRAFAWSGLLIAALSGAGWLILQTVYMSGLSAAEVLAERAVWTTLSQTGFGHIWIVRAAIWIALALAFLWLDVERRARWAGMPVALLAAAFAGALAWAGHAAASEGILGSVHVAADALHVVAAAAWVGALIPLALALGVAAREHHVRALTAACSVTLRFSSFGIACVATVVLTGAVNTWMLAGSVDALVGTAYGRLLLIKIALFLCMLMIAAINRQRLTPRLVDADDAGAGKRALNRLRRNSLIEVALGAIILCIVGALGILPPGAE
ncbi:MAG TPA: copper homeostasis membrane protein CopD [Pseudolabrys sp.]|nr:copper homeostasis membrane protein CopD [Pseudolabrys sp.]